MRVGAIAQVLNIPSYSSRSLRVRMTGLGMVRQILARSGRRVNRGGAVLLRQPTPGLLRLSDRRCVHDPGFEEGRGRYCVGDGGRGGLGANTEAVRDEE